MKHRAPTFAKEDLTSKMEEIRDLETGTSLQLFSAMVVVVQAHDRYLQHTGPRLYISIPAPETRTLAFHRTCHERGWVC